MALGHFLMAGPALGPWLVESLSGVPVELILTSSGVELGHASLSPEIRAGLEAAAVTTLAVPSVSAEVMSALEWAYLSQGWSFYGAISFLILGNGLFKPNMSTMVGNLYAPGDERIDSGYTIFYMGINLGAFLSGIIAGGIGELYGWHYGFTIAGFGMVAGKLDIPSDSLLQYGPDKGKVSLDYIASQADKQDGKLILVTAIPNTCG